MFIVKNKLDVNGNFISRWVFGLSSMFFSAVVNAAIVQHTGAINAHTTWSANDIHQITGDVTVASGIILTIESGALVKFNSGRSLLINGALNAVGIASNKIIFTSYRDDSAGGDTNGDGVSVGQPGDWGRIQFSDLVTDSLTRLEQVDIRYAGGGSIGSVYMINANVAIVDSEIHDGSSYGIYLRNQSSPVIEGNVIRDHVLDGIYANNSSANSSPLIRNNTIRGNRNGIYAQYITPSIEDNTITGNADWGLYYFDARNAPVMTGNTITGNKRGARIPASAVPGASDNNVLVPNQINGLWILGNTRTADLQLSVQTGAAGEELNSYVIYNTLTVASGTTLTVDPGVVVKLGPNASLDINGALSAVGTPAQRIGFTSEKDDALGGDQNADGYGSAPANGDWGRIYFSPQADDANSVIEYAVIRYGGNAGNGMLYIRQTDMRVAHSTLSNSSTHGLRSYRSSPVLDDLTVYGNTQDGLYCEQTGSPVVTNSRIFANADDGVDVRHSVTASVTGGEVFANGGNGINNTSSNAVDATDTWWGAADGPSGAFGGSGDEVTANVTVDGILTNFKTDGTEFSYFNAGSNLSEGTLVSPVVTQGTADLTGATPQTSLLYDADRIILDYSGLAATTAYDLFLTYYNPDDASGIGGNLQRLLDVNDAVIHDRLHVNATPTQSHYPVPSTALGVGGALRLNSVRDNGHRATVSEVLLIERIDTGDSTAPSGAITSPAANAHVTGGVVTVRGTATDTTGSGVASVELGIDAGAGLVWQPVTSLHTDNSWSYRWVLPSDGAYTLYIRVMDQVGNVNVSVTGTTVIVNQTPPAPATSVVAFDTPADSGGSVTVNWVLSSDDGANANDVASYAIERQSGSSGFTEVGSVSAGTNSFVDSTAVTGTSYVYRVTAVDLASNRIASIVSAAIAAIDNAGTSDTTPPEEVTNLTATAGSGFVYLTWTRSVDSAGDLIDQLLDISADGGATWGAVGPAYTDGGTLSLGKAANTYLVSGLVNSTGYKFRLRVQDAAAPANTSAGVQTNVVAPSVSAYTTVSGVIAQDAEWAAGVYYVANDVTVNSGVTLTIRPGVIVKFASGRTLDVRGTLLAQGTSGNEVVFTAFTDDSVGGDTNGDGPSSGTLGYWGHVQLYDSGSSASRMDHAVVRYGGSSGLGNLYLYRNAAQIRNTQSRDSLYYGIYVRQATAPVLENNTFANNVRSGVYINGGSDAVIRDNTIDTNNTIGSASESGLTITSSTPAVIEGNTITNNTGYGIFFNSSNNTGPIKNNIITGNDKPVRLPFSALPGVNDGNTLSPNTQDQIEIYGNSRTVELTLPAGPVYYLVSGTAIMATGARLTLAPGLIWKSASNTGLTINGALQAVGDAANRVVFTSYRDDSMGGDTNGDGASDGQPGDWSHIQFNDSVIDFITRLEQVDIRYAGGGSIGSVYMINANVAIVDSEIHDGSSYGIYLRNQSSPVIEGNVIRDHVLDGIYANNSSANSSPLIRNNTIRGNRNGIYAQYITPSIEDNTITGNADWGLYYFDARNAPVMTGNTITGNKRGARIPASAVPGASDNNVLVPNQINGLWILGNTRTADLQLSVQTGAAGEELNSYVIYNTLTVASGTTLTVDPGVVVKLGPNASLDINGALSAVGTPAQRIGFTSEKDDALGGDQNADGYGSAPANGDWGRIYFSPQADDANSVIEYAVIRYGGNAGNGMLYIRQTDMRVAHSTLSNSSTHGLRSYQSSPVLDDLTVFGHTQDGLHFEQTGSPVVTNSRLFANADDGVEVLNSVTASVTGGEVFANGGNGINNTSSNAVDATDTWWGAADGPSGAFGGSGDEVTANVTVDGILTNFKTDGTEFSYFNAGANLSEGTLVSPVVTQGTVDLTGATPQTSLLYDADRVILDYSGLAATTAYDLFLTYYNPDDASGIGGNLQRLLDANDAVIHDTLRVHATPTQSHYPVPSTALGVGGALRLNSVRDNGYRTTLSEVLLIERTDTGDSTAPSGAITSPVANAQVTGGVATVRGTATDTTGSGVAAVDLGIDAGAGIVWQPVTSLHTDNSWSYRWVLPSDGAYTLYTRVTDQAGNVGVLSTGTTVIVNQTPPTPATSVVAFDTPADSGGSVTVNWVLSSDDGANANDVASYAIERQSGSSGFTEVGSVSAGANSLVDSTAVTGTSYVYRVTAVDLAGNRIASIVSAAIAAIDNAGTSDTTPPEEVTNLTATAGSGFVYLTWTRSVDSAGDLIDQLLDISADGGATWGAVGPAYTDGGTLSLGKAANTYLVSGLVNSTGYKFRLRVQDAAAPANTSAGVQTNVVAPSVSAYTTVSGVIAQDAEWAAGVYYVANDVTVNSGVTLTIRPGVIVKFASGRTLDVRGTLLAQGTSGNEVVFTAFTDDSVGGDTNGDGPSSGTLGYWGHVQLYDSGSSASRMDHAVVRYGGSSGLGNLYLYRNAAQIRNTQSRDSLYYGIYVRQATAPVLENNTFANNVRSGVYINGGSDAVIRDNTIDTNNTIGSASESGLTITSSTPAVIEGNTITNNTGYGIFFNSSNNTGPIKNNIITGNDKPVRLPFSALPGVNDGNTLSPNTQDQIEIYGNSRTVELTLPAGPVYYLVSGTAIMATGARLTLAPGLIWKSASNTGLTINGALQAVGDAANRVVFTSYRDDSMGGDTNGDGASDGQPGDWSHIQFNDSVIDFITRLEQVDIRYAGGGSIGSVYMINANVAIVDSEIHDGSSYGIYLRNQSSPVIEGNVIRDHVLDGIYANNSSANSSPLIRNNTIRGNRNGIYAQYITPSIEDNTITGNADWGLYYFDARNAPVMTGNTITGNKRGARIPASAVPGASDNNVLVPNQINGLWILGNTRTADLQLSVQTGAAGEELNSYVIYNTLTVASGTTLTVDPGVVVKLGPNASLDINGALSAVGTPAQRIGFTSEKDDALGGDQNADGYGSAPANGDWGRIYFSPQADDANSVIEYAVIRYGGNAGNGMLYIRQTDMRVAHSTLSNSSTHGLRSYQSSPVLDDLTVFGHTQDGLHFEQTGSPVVTNSRLFANADDGVEVLNSVTASVTGGEVFANGGNGINNTSSNAVDATDTWWGAADGPSGAFGGSGDEVTANVTVDGILTNFKTDGTEFSYFNAGGIDHENYGISTPIVSGTPSNAWGSTANKTVLFNNTSKTITIEYTGLSDTSTYQLLVTYYTQDSGDTTQTLTDSNGLAIHESLLLPKIAPTTYRYTIPKNSIDLGNLRLNLDALTGPRVSVATLTLLKEVSLDTTAPSVSINNPLSGDKLPAGDISITGTAVDAGGEIIRLEVGIQPAGAAINWYPISQQAAANNWLYRWISPAAGDYQLYARAIDAGGNIQITPIPVAVTVDAGLPQAATGVIAQAVGSGIKVLWTLSADDGAGANDVVRYDIYRSVDQSGSYTQVGSVNAGVSSFDDASITSGQDYYYFVRVVDQAGNHTDSSTYGAVANTGAVDTVPPEEVTNLTAQATQSNGGNVSVYLTWTGSANSQGDLAEQRIAVSIDGGTTFGNNGPTYDNGQVFTLGRSTHSYQLGGLIANQAYVFKLTTADFVPNESPGVTVSVTPTGAATETVTLTGTFSEDTILGQGVFKVGSSLTVPAGVTLTLSPGSILKFCTGCVLDVRGTLLAQGTSGNEVVFTAFTDDSVGGDTNGDGVSSGTPGYWGRVQFFDSGSSASRLEHAVVRYGGSSGLGNLYIYRNAAQIRHTQSRDSLYYGIYVGQAPAPVLEDNTFADNASSGVYITGGNDAVIRGNTLDNNNTSGSASNAGLYISNSTPAVIEGNTITNNSGYGIFFNSGYNVSPIKNNIITGNTVSVRVPASAAPDSTNVLTPNANPYIELLGNTVTTDILFRKWAAGTPEEVSTYIIHGDMTVPQYLYLNVDPGVVVKFDVNNQLTINGALIANGNIAEKVVFTSLVDDSESGDSNGDGTNTAPANGNWGGIVFNDSLFESFSVVNHVKVRYAGANGSGNLYLNQADIRIENSEISNSSSNGIRVYRSSPVITGSRIWGNTQDGIKVDHSSSDALITFNRITTNLSDGIEVLNSARATATNNQIFQNRGLGLRNSTANTIDATQSWWGDVDSSGPFNAANNSGGSGSEVSDTVTFSPYQTAIGTAFVYTNLTASGTVDQGSIAAPLLIQGTLSDEWDASSLSPAKTMAWHADEVTMAYASGLDPAKRYKVRVNYYSGDSAAVLQSITDGNGDPIHASLRMPQSTPTQFEYSIPPAYYATGGITLNFVHDNPATSIRAAISEVWIMEDPLELTPPRFDAILFNDIDGDGGLSVGDEYHFVFSEAMDTTLIADATTDANQKLQTAGGQIYGTTNQLRWSADERTVIVTLTAGFSVTGTELVTPQNLTDQFGNAAIGSQTLTSQDNVAPILLAIDFVDVDNSGLLSLGDEYNFRFSEAMNDSVIADSSTDANAQLRPEGGARYGNTNTVVWSADKQVVTVTVTSGYTIQGNEQVIPSSFVTDAAGNSVTGTQFLSGHDDTAPQITGIAYDDVNGDGVVSVGDQYVFSFSEPLFQGALSEGTTEANSNLSPAGLSYGTVNTIAWDAAGNQVSITITNGFTLTGSEVVTPSSFLTDLAGNPVTNTGVLTLVDTVVPTIVSAQGSINSPVPANTNYQVILQFSSSMDTQSAPQVLLTTTSGTPPIVPTGGTWSATVYPDDTYTAPVITLDASLDATINVDVSGAQDTFAHVMDLLTGAYSFVIEGGAPAITSHPVAPAVTALNTTTVTLAGDRQDNRSIWAGSTEIVPIGSGPWSAVVNLLQGQNDLVIVQKDSAGNASAPVTVSFFVDSNAPVFTSSQPSNNSFLAQPPASISIQFSETGGSLDVGNSVLSVSRDGSPVSGVWALSGGDLVFTPDQPLLDGAYQISGQLTDSSGLHSSVFNVAFTIDRIPPPAPTVDNPPVSTGVSPLPLSGTKEADSAVLLNGQQIVTNTPETTWAAQIPLANGVNQLSFTVTDRAGNVSPAVQISISYDNTTPGAVTVVADGAGDGTSVQLDWSAYDEVANGNDINHYTVYIATSNFTTISGATAIATIPAGTKTYQAIGLVRGQTYYFAVVASDNSGNALSNVTAVAVTPGDTTPPEEVTNLTITPLADQLGVSWTASANSANDLAVYRVSVDGAAGTSIAGTTYTVTGLTPATAYTIRVTAVDADNNESAGVSIAAATLLPNPGGLTVTPSHSQVSLSWNPVLPAGLVKQYAIYRSTSNFTSIAGLTPALVVGAGSTTAQVAGLTNGTTYYFAVTTINISDGQTQAVSTVAGTPLADTNGPQISSVTFAGAPLVDGQTIAQSGVLAVTATDAGGLSRVEFKVDGALLSTDVDGSNGYTAVWDIVNITDGPHTVSVTVYDVQDNATTQTFNVTVALSAPPVPVITSPADGFTTNSNLLLVTGTSALDTDVLITLNGTQVGTPITVDGNGHFQRSVSLVAGANTLVVAAQNRGGVGPSSASITVTLDISVPDAPIGLTATSKADGQITLSWNTVSDDRVVGYDLYRATTAFTDISAAAKANNSTVTTPFYNDLPGADGTYYYRVVAVNDLGTPSAPSSAVTGLADSVPPIANSIVYVPSGNVDAATGRMAPGRVDVTVDVSEPLLTTPFLSLTPNGGIPISVTLSPVDELTYTGSFDITQTTKTGITYAVFSARDVVGNRGSQVTTGASIEIDTDGPAVTRLTVTPVSPIKNDATNPVTVNVEIELDQAPKVGTQPTLSYLLSGAGRLETPLANLVEFTPLIWRGSFVLPADAGQAVVEMLNFVLNSVDDLDNPGTAFLVPNQFQVYQGNLPPLDAPANLTATVLPGGAVQLDWDPVTDAVAYQLYRQGPGETQLLAYQQVTNPTFTDTALADGDYTYAVASVRQENGQEAISGQSNSVTVTADATVPGVPQNLTLQLVGAGIKTLWQAPASNTETLTYNLYRSTGTVLTDVTGLTPVQTDIGANTQGVLGFIDTAPDQNQPVYAVTAIDAAGNESLPSTSAFLNVALLPVNTLNVTQVDTSLPVVAWTHSSTGISGYNLYLNNSTTPVNSTLLTAFNYTDVGYAANERRYRITAIDSNAVESLERIVLLPKLDAQLINGSPIQRGVMNRLTYTVTNASASDMTGIQLKVNIEGVEHSSITFGVAAASTQNVDVIVGGQQSLPDLPAVITTLHITATTGETVDIIRNGTLDVADGALLLNIQTQELTRNTAGQVRFSLENTSAVETELVMASGSLPSNEIRLLLRDVDGNVLSTQTVQQSTGSGVITLPSGKTVARVAPGDTFLSDWFGVPIPDSAPDDVEVVLEIDQVHYHLGQADHVAIAGKGGSQAATLLDTAYAATVDNITPQSSFGDQPVVITGQALDRATTQPLPSVAIKLVIAVNGFERTAEVFTDAAGLYTYSFDPLAGESGVFTVSAIHPDVIARPAQTQFTINRVTVSPNQLNLRLARNIEQALSVVKATAGEATTATNVRLVYEAADQPTGAFVPGLTVNLGAPVNLTSQQSASLPLTIVGDNTASDTGQVVLKVVSDESGTTPLANVTIDYQLSAANPALFFTPNFVETGVAHDGSVNEVITLENKGLAELTNVNVELLTDTDQPAPNWLYLTTTPALGNLAVGATSAVQFTANPPATVIEGIYPFKLQVTSDNHPTTDINVFVSVTQSGIGNVLFKTSDIYTATLDDNGVPIPGLAGARIKLQNEQVISIEQTLNTDSAGEALFTGLPAGRYRYRATAANHQDLSGRLTIKPGITAAEEAFLDYNLITVEWSVTEITIDDKYVITLQATFETDVPAAVVVMEPSSTTLPPMAEGEVFYGELRLTNYGLIRADNLNFSLPGSDAYFRYEFLGGLPNELNAKDSIVMPYRVTALSATDPDGTGSGGGCSPYNNNVNANYNYVCANGTTTSGGTSSSFNRPTSTSGCGGSGGPSIYYGSGGGNGGGFGGSGGGGYSSIPGASCPEPCPDGTCCSGGGSGGDGNGGDGGGPGPEF